MNEKERSIPQFELFMRIIWEHLWTYLSPRSSPTDDFHDDGPTWTTREYDWTVMLWSNRWHWMPAKERKRRDVILSVCGTRVFFARHVGVVLTTWWRPVPQTREICQSVTRSERALEELWRLTHHNCFKSIQASQIQTPECRGRCSMKRSSMSTRAPAAISRFYGGRKIFTILLSYITSISDMLEYSTTKYTDAPEYYRIMWPGTRPHILLSDLISIQLYQSSARILLDIGGREYTQNK